MDNRIRELRKERGLTLTQLAELVGTSNQQISHLEKGRRRLTHDWMERIARVLNCRPAELLEKNVGRLTERETAFVEIFRELSDEQQDALFKATTALAKPEVTIKEHVAKK